MSVEVADWAREERDSSFFNAGRHMLRAIRRYQYFKNRWGLLGKLICKISSIENSFWGLLSGCYLPIDGDFGGGLLLPHPSGIIVHNDVRIGVNCLIFQPVTIGTCKGNCGTPTIGNHVDIGAGAKILGRISIGDHAKIGANAVVLCDVPAGATAVGIPARIIPDKRM